MTATQLALMAPFVLLLGAMALAPVLAHKWWSKHYPKAALGLGAITACIYLFVLRDFASLGRAVHEYISFITLVGSLYIVAGGIHLRVPAGATPQANVVFLFAGAVAANVLGTTGSAMLLIRPWIHMNRGRIAPYQIAFFIFLVANVGGCLTPIGDPPLFLGFLEGVPFWWVAQKCWPMWAVGTGMLLAIFYLVDRTAFAQNRESRPQADVANQNWHIEGLPNLFFLAILVGAVFIQHPIFVREAIMAAAAVGSYFTTKKITHTANEFNFHPAIEVAVLFAGIFVTMIPALEWLDHGARRLMGADPSAAIFFWGTGALSAVLDNAPTYLGFLSALLGVTDTHEIADLLNQRATHIAAISIGSVFFGAATYIGNGPNFMIKAIAEQRGVRMPSFMHFVLRYSLPFLLPVLITVWLLFFRG